MQGGGAAGKVGEGGWGNFGNAQKKGRFLGFLPPTLPKSVFLDTTVNYILLYIATSRYSYEGLSEDMHTWFFLYDEKVHNTLFTLIIHLDYVNHGQNHDHTEKKLLMQTIPTISS